jgi:putative flavoprotein involved in K+ transport
MCLYGPLEDIRGSRIDFAPGLKKNLEHADDVYRNINRSIDSYIEKQKIDAPPQTPYAPVWEAPEEVRSLDLLESGVGSIVWCIGFSTAFGWVKAPVFDEAGYPRQTRGVTGVDGLYFIGLPWLYTWGSGRFSGVGRDARFICDRIDELRSRRTVASARDRSLSLGS